MATIEPGLRETVSLDGSVGKLVGIDVGCSVLKKVGKLVGESVFLICDRPSLGKLREENRGGGLKK